MTIKKSLELAISIVSESNNPDKDEITRALQICHDTLHTMQWTKELVFDACDQFILENQRDITVTDFDHALLPRHTTIKRLFHMTAAEFRDKYYPLLTFARSISSPYRRKSEEEVIQMFVDEFHRVKPHSQEDFAARYDRKRSPCWDTVAKYCGIPHRWTSVLQYLNLKPYPKQERKPTQLSVTSNSELLKKCKKS